MKKFVAFMALIALPAAAADPGDCARLSALYEIRSLMMKRYSSSYQVGTVIDRRLADLRQGYIIWVRRDADAPTDKKVHKLRAGAADRFESDGNHAFAVRIVVPSKRSLFNANSPVAIGTVTINSTINGRTSTRTERIGATLNPDNSRTFDLGAIADHVEVAVDVSAPNGEAVVETHYRQAVAEDDPANPAYSTIQSLTRLGTSPDARTIDAEIASAERTLFPGSDPMPLLSIIEDLRRADELIRSKKQEDQEKGDKLLKETLRRLR
ncbi:MAG: hypothetical protein QOE68_1550 [Thermoanaerobaculia bacterium]|nr:hypothetical protein [Thermoanaerobaculia bacterium]